MIWQPPLMVLADPQHFSGILIMVLIFRAALPPLISRSHINESWHWRLDADSWNARSLLQHGQEPTSFNHSQEGPGKVFLRRRGGRAGGRGRGSREVGNGGWEQEERQGSFWRAYDKNRYSQQAPSSSPKLTLESILVYWEEVGHYREIPNRLQYFAINSENTCVMLGNGNGSLRRQFTSLCEKQWWLGAGGRVLT